MRLYFVPPEDGKPLHEGTLITEDGDEVEGILVTETWRGATGPTAVQFTILAEKVSELDESTLQRTLKEMIALERALAE